ncbi:16S rRNA (guanine(966)-N(2))-methyltransferase RsmD [Paenibacillus sp. SYP-B3998]|uniref:16S rRNA (Guanine(966)-N(2))-methyltransferase RsmD n=1 Tax=Paenibacillus sp. SYP-B3998 TaxID=2678564 RepID=A0A6G3ZTV8_9BACL|nr:16S rRNA (guanine(966)-N(2))-methyltransferase RsmD [Paenibacillus sp. SYP-B3998]NEW05500.1 16S rRNA (guanine(966)-N(2))-methyltransferase RsmD [Paenibacillus sp. SYP-B3998]
MRVISGSAKGRLLKAVPGTSTRPTTDKVKESIFSMIGPYFDGGQVLDLFAGTGGLGIEALSRGMNRAVFIDIEKKSVDTIQHNLQATGLKEQAEIYRTDATRALKSLAKREQQFELVFLDPPYKMKVIAELISSMEAQGLLEAQAIIVVEHDVKDVLVESIGEFVQQRRAEYGDTAVTIYKRVIQHLQL